MSLPNIAVLGATGVVGREILSILIENDVKYDKIKFWHQKRVQAKKSNSKEKNIQ